MEKLELKNEDRTKCEVWTRVMGYYRPISSFNEGKRSEYQDRRYFHEESGKCDISDGERKDGKV